MSEETHGQQNRKRIREQIEHVLGKYCPNTFNRMANLIAYDFNLCPDTLKYSYLPMWIDVGILELNSDNLYVLSTKGQNLQTTEDGLTDEQLREEFEEENEQRSKLGKPRVTLEEWRKKRDKRIEPIK